MYQRQTHSNTIKKSTKMSNSSSSKRSLFQEAIDHCRWKSVLRKYVLSHNELQEHNLHKFADKCFEEIFSRVYNICYNVAGVGDLTIYDIAAAICLYNNIIIQKIYIIGNGPKRAISFSLLNIKTKTQKIDGVSLRYVEIPEVLKAFNEKNYEVDPYIKNSHNGDHWESYLCNWQKDK